eukprot:COSAG02_NODE_8785_length_2448_cov_1.866752_2_plen_254_part_00
MPASWKWRVLHDVNEIETSFEHASGSSAGADQQDMPEPFSYRLWLMVHTGLQHVTHADTLLELQLVIHNSGADGIYLNVVHSLNRSNPRESAGVANVRGQRSQNLCAAGWLPLTLLLAACCLLPASSWLMPVRCLVLNLSAASRQLNMCLLDAHDLGPNRLWVLFCGCVPTQRQILRFSRSCESALRDSTLMHRRQSTFTLRRIILNMDHTDLRFRRELAQLAALPLQDWLAAAIQAEIGKIMDSKRTAMNVS